MWKMLAAILESLSSPVGDGDDLFRVQSIPGFDKHFIGRDTLGRPVLLLVAAEQTPIAATAPLRLRYIRVQHDVRCRVSSDAGAVTEITCSLLQCLAADSALHIYFLQAVASLVNLMGPAPSRATITTLVRRFAELFYTLTQPPRKPIQGLWAELFLMAESPGPLTLCNAWRNLPEERFDFALGPYRIEVKSTRSHLRRHRFSLEQLLPNPNRIILVASVILEPSNSGPSIADLLSIIRRRIASHPDILFRLEEAVALTLGEGIETIGAVRFDREMALDSMRYFDGASVPAIRAPIPEGVSRIEFDSDLSLAPVVDRHSEIFSSDLFKALPHERP